MKFKIPIRKISAVLLTLLMTACGMSTDSDKNGQDSDVTAISVTKEGEIVSTVGEIEKNTDEVTLSAFLEGADLRFDTTMEVPTCQAADLYGHTYNYYDVNSLEADVLYKIAAFNDGSAVYGLIHKFVFSVSYRISFIFAVSASDRKSVV